MKQKGIFLIFNPALETEVMGLLEKNNSCHYTKFPYLHGEGGHSEPRLDTQVWPGSNMAVFVVVDEETAVALLKDMAALKKKRMKDGVKAFAFPIEAVI